VRQSPRQCAANREDAVIALPVPVPGPISYDTVEEEAVLAGRGVEVEAAGDGGAELASAAAAGHGRRLVGPLSRDRVADDVGERIGDEGSAGPPLLQHKQAVERSIQYELGACAVSVRGCQARVVKLAMMMPVVVAAGRQGVEVVVCWRERVVLRA
jgi:hypothetical protein